MAGGYWLHIAGQNLLDPAPTVTGAEMGAFVDGLELRSHPVSLPTTGTARYDGQVTGVYAGHTGTGGPRRVALREARKSASSGQPSR